MQHEAERKLELWQKLEAEKVREAEKVCQKLSSSRS